MLASLPGRVQFATRSILTHAVIGQQLRNDKNKAAGVNRYDSESLRTSCKASTNATYDLTLIARIASRIDRRSAPGLRSALIGHTFCFL